MFKIGKFEDKNEIVKCTPDIQQYYKLDKHTHAGLFWGYHNITAQDVKCVKFNGVASDLHQNLMPTRYKWVLWIFPYCFHNNFSSILYRL